MHTHNILEWALAKTLPSIFNESIRIKITLKQDFYFFWAEALIFASQNYNERRISSAILHECP